jgi:hypothetical protein
VAPHAHTERRTHNDRKTHKDLAMTHSSSISLPAPASPDPAAAAYQPGQCNIGPAEIARRRRAGHVGSLGAGALLAGLVLSGAPRWTRLLVALPAAGAASGYLQASLRFCAGFGSRGVYNFGPLGETETVADPEARARDRARAMQIGLGALAIGGAVGVAASALPVRRPATS